MTIAQIMLRIGICSLLSACQVGLASHPQSFQSESPVSSAAPTPQPVPDVSPSVEGLQRYVNNVYCEDLAESLRSQKLDSIQDVVVSPDGDRVYFTYSRENFVKNPQNSFSLSQSILPSSSQRILPHQFIYLLDQKGRISELRIAGSPPHSCYLRGEIEKDAQGRLIFNRPFFEDNTTANNPTRQYTLYSWTPGQDTFKIWKEVDLNTPDPSPSAYRAREMTQLHIPADQTDTIYYGLITPFTGNSPSYIQKRGRDAAPENILIKPYGGGLYRFSMLPNGELIYGARRILPPYPFEANNYSPEEGLAEQPLLTDESPFQVSASRVSPDGKLVYISDGKQSHSIWKIDLASRQATRLAGNGQAGYRDGADQETQLNQPGELDLDTAGNLYVADVGNIAIRKITPTGQVSTLFKRPTL
ncbi:MAG: hypothetical protein ACO1RX_02080 [Candidatus Sericytochromatia bacterium]